MDTKRFVLLNSKALVVVFAFQVTYIKLSILLSPLGNDDMEASKHCGKLLLLIFILKCLPKFNLIQLLFVLLKT